MDCSWLIKRLEEYGDREAIIRCGQSSSYRQLGDSIKNWRNRLVDIDLKPGQIVAIEGDYSIAVSALLLALIENQNIIVPLTSAVATQKKDEFLKMACVQFVFRFAEQNSWQMERRAVDPIHPLLKQLQEAGAPGLVLFSSGSTGQSKAAVHDFSQLLEKFKAKRQCLRTLVFLRLDHIGGINTLFYTLANGGTLVSVEDRRPETVCVTIEKHGVELLPTSPTFLNLLLMSEEYQHFDLSSLKLITYGTEPMSETTLQRLNTVFPNVRFQQTYGLSELGILHSKSKDSSSLWVKVGGEGFETKVVDHILWIRSKSAMLGYLNAPSPFDDEGWFNTQDQVEVNNGEYIRILGRETDLINVGGEKVYPAEVESVLLELENVRDVTVWGEKNPILENIVVAAFNLFKPESVDSLKSRVHKFSKGKLAPYKVPVRIKISDGLAVGARFKKLRGPSLQAKVAQKEITP